MNLYEQTDIDDDFGHDIDSDIGNNLDHVIADDDFLIYIYIYAYFIMVQDHAPIMSNNIIAVLKANWQKCCKQF